MWKDILIACLIGYIVCSHFGAAVVLHTLQQAGTDVIAEWKKFRASRQSK
jgi:hypothetical protein